MTENRKALTTKVTENAQRKASELRVTRKIKQKLDSVSRTADRNDAAKAVGKAKALGAETSSA